MPRLCTQLRQALQVVQEKIAAFDAEMEKVGETRNTQPVLELRKEIQERIDQLKNNPELKLKRLERIIGHKIETLPVTIGGKTREQLIQEMEAKNISISDYTKEMMAKMEISSNPEQLKLVSLTVKDLGFPNGATTAEIYQRAEDLGLELCPAETGPSLRLQNSLPDLMFIGMKQFAGCDGYSAVFFLGQSAGRLILDDNWAAPDGRWATDYLWVFSLAS